MNDRRSDPIEGPVDADGPADTGPRTIRHLSHDIRAAMSDVIGGLRLIDARRLDAQTQTQFDRVRSAADTLAALVDHALFELAGESPMARDAGPVALQMWLESLSQRWQGQAAEQGRAFRIRQTGDLPTHVRVSPVALTRVVGNLVANAMRHVPDGDVEVSVEVPADGGLRITVQDEGPGFPTDVLEGASHGPMGPTGGSGLGLRIARELSELLGAPLTLSNTVQGARASLRFAPDLVDTTPVADPPPPGPDLSALRLLVAEDNLTNQTILRQMLEAMGAKPMIVADGRAALTELTRTAYDIALLDIEMPELSGLEVMEAVRSMAGPVAAMPLVAITAYVLRDNREAIYAAGADGIIGKPVASAHDLGYAILRHVGDAAPDELAEGRPLAVGTFLDKDRFEQLLEAAGPEGRAELLLRLGEDLSVTLETMERAMAARDTTELRAQTHILIAISGAIGADRLCHNSETFNIAAKRRSTDRFAVLYPPIRADLVALIKAVAKRRAEDAAGM